MAGAANLTDPEVLAALRQALGAFRIRVADTIAGAPTLLARTQDRLAHELAPYWKREAQRRAEAYGEARRRWLAAEAEVRASGARGAVDRSSSGEERKEMQRAQRRLDEAEQRQAAIRTWRNRLDGDGKDLLAKLRDHGRALDEQTAAALLRLDRMIEGVDAYLRQGGTAP